MSRQESIDERIGGLLEGRLSAEARAELMRELAADPMLVERLANAARATADSESEQFTTETRTATRPRFRPRLAYVLPLAAAAAVAVVLIVPRPRDVIAGPELIALTDPLVTTGGEGSVDRNFGPGWAYSGSGVRGNDVNRELAFLAGAQITDLRLALNSGDSVAARLVLPSLIRSLRTLQGASPYAVRMSAFSGKLSANTPPRELLAETTTTAESLRLLMQDGPWFDLGIWVESARLAVLKRDTTFFAPAGPANRELTRFIADREAQLPPDLLSELQSLEGLLRSEATPRPMDALRSRLEAIAAASL